MERVRSLHSRDSRGAARPSWYWLFERVPRENGGEDVELGPADPGQCKSALSSSADALKKLGQVFYMGGQRFIFSPVESFLFWANGTSDHYFLPAARAPPRPPAGGQTSSAHASAIISSLALMRATLKLARDDTDPPDAYRVRFEFDCTSPCRITVHLCARRGLGPGSQHSYVSVASSPSYDYPTGCSQKFEQDYGLPISIVDRKKLTWAPGADCWPLVVLMESVDAEGSTRQTLVTLATFEDFDMARIRVSVLKQLLTHEDATYMVQDIYGIDTASEYGGGAADVQGEELDEEALDDMTSCIVCMCDPRDTVVLPCRHLCLCRDCADVLRNQSNKCPLCRAPFYSLLRIRLARPRTEEDTGADDTEKIEVEGATYTTVGLVQPNAETRGATAEPEETDRFVGDDSASGKDDPMPASTMRDSAAQLLTGSSPLEHKSQLGDKRASDAQRVVAARGGDEVLDIGGSDEDDEEN